MTWSVRSGHSGSNFHCAYIFSYVVALRLTSISTPIVELDTASSDITIPYFICTYRSLACREQRNLYNPDVNNTSIGTNNHFSHSPERNGVMTGGFWEDTVTLASLKAPNQTVGGAMLYDETFPPQRPRRTVCSASHFTTSPAGKTVNSQLSSQRKSRSGPSVPSDNDCGGQGSFC